MDSAVDDLSIRAYARFFQSALVAHHSTLQQTFSMLHLKVIFALLLCIALTSAMPFGGQV
ncbi:hypothetical protein MMC17_006420 [Xylographa soralifera]|nr:hypothetical protein [Xylographa soralifera]